MTNGANGFLTTLCWTRHAGFRRRGMAIDLFAIEGEKRTHIRSMTTNS